MTAPFIPSGRRCQPGGGRRKRLVVGLVNNMSDGALQATESQFCALLRAAAPSSADVVVRFFSLAEVRRSEAMRAHMRGRYRSIDALEREGVDALVVTGAEPRCAEFEDEPYWPSLARVIDWVDAEQIPTAWSCLAAHAAVWRLHRIPRQRSQAKRNGVFALQKTAGHPLLEGAPETPFAPHSRWNDLDGAQLQSAGFEILTCSDETGVDTFAQTGRTTSLFFQGHPEYDAGALGREYVRDVSRYLRGQQPALPPPPRNYFDHETLAALADLSARLQCGGDAAALAELARLVEAQTPAARWHTWAGHAYRAWLRQFSDRATDDLPAVAAEAPTHSMPL